MPPSPALGATSTPSAPLSDLRAHARANGTRLAILDRDRELCFSELLDAVYAVMADLRERGVREGAVVAVALPNTWQYAALEIAVPALGAVILPIPVQLGSREVESALLGSGATTVVIDSADPDCVVGSTARLLPTRPTIVGVDELDFERSEHDLRSLVVNPDPDRIVQIALTSGTTGLPKLASLSARLKQLTSEAFGGRLRFRPGDRVLPMSPVTQGVGEMCLYALRAGAAIVMSRDVRFSPERMLTLAQDSEATVLGVVPTMLGRLLRADGVEAIDLRYVRATISAGAPLSPVIAEAWERLSGSATCSFYGAMDIGQLAVGCPDDPADKRWTSVGRPHDIADWQICDHEGAVMPTGETGEICMRGPLVQQRYWGESTSPFADDGWAHFGDLGFVDDDGYLHITGRLKDTIIRGGNNINPLEVEQLLRQHPQIHDACVVGRPDADLGEQTVAFLVTATDVELGTPDIAAFLAKRGLTRFKWPESVITVPVLPTGVTGKVNRAALRALALDEMHTGTGIPHVAD